MSFRARAAGLDALVAAAQAGERPALDALCARVAGPMAAYARRVLGPGPDAEDAAQEVLARIAGRIGTYRRDGSFLGWCYALASRDLARARARRGRDLARAAGAVEVALLADHEPVGGAAWRLLEHEAHLACAAGVLAGLSEDVRLAYVLGDLLGVPDAVGAAVCGVAPAAYRQRRSRARRRVTAAVLAGPPADAPPGLHHAADELCRVTDLGELHRAAGRPAREPEAVVRALRAAGPTLVPGLAGPSRGQPRSAPAASPEGPGPAAGPAREQGQDPRGRRVNLGRVDDQPLAGVVRRRHDLDVEGQQPRDGVADALGHGGVGAHPVVLPPAVDIRIGRAQPRRPALAAGRRAGAAPPPSAACRRAPARSRPS